MTANESLQQHFMRYTFQNIFCHSGCPCEKNYFICQRGMQPDLFCNFLLPCEDEYICGCQTFTFLMQIICMWHLIQYIGLEYFNSCFSLSSFKELKFFHKLTTCHLALLHIINVSVGHCECLQLFVIKSIHQPQNSPSTAF